jgi:hypothetical protein
LAFSSILHDGSRYILAYKQHGTSQFWFNFVATMLLGELTRRNPQLRDRLRAATAA